MVNGHSGDRGRDVVQHATRDKEIVSGHALILLQKMVERTAQGRLHRANLVKFNFVQSTVVGVLGQDSVAVAELAVEDGNISHGLAQILSLDMEEEIASVSDLYHLLATHNAVQCMVVGVHGDLFQVVHVRVEGVKNQEPVFATVQHLVVTESLAREIIRTYSHATSKHAQRHLQHLFQ